MTSVGANKPLAWITGANGLIGNYLVQTAPRFAPRWRVRALTRADFDLLDFAAVEREFHKDQPQLVIHCAAITVVGDAQKNPDSGAARECRGHANCSRNWRRKFHSFSFPRIWFSTGAREIMPKRTRRIRCMFTARRKLAAEEIVLKNPRHLVVRTSINGGMSRAGGRAFQRAVAPLVAGGRAGDDAVHGRVSLPDSGGGNGAGGLGAGGEKLRGNLSRRRRGKIVASANRRIAGQTLAGNQDENRIRFGQGFSRPAARAGHVAGHFQGAKSFVRAAARLGRMAGTPSARGFLIAPREPN